MIKKIKSTKVYLNKWLNIQNIHKVLVLIATLPWIYFTFKMIFRGDLTISSFVNFASLMLFLVAFFSVKVLSHKTHRYQKFLIVLLVSYLFSLLMRQIIFLIQGIVFLFYFPIYVFFGRSIEIEISLILSLVLTYLLFFHKTVFLNKNTSILEKISFFWLVGLLTFEATLTTLKAYISISGWVSDSMRSVSLLVLLVIILRFRLYKTFVGAKVKKVLKKLLLFFAFVVAVSFSHTLFEIQYIHVINNRLEQNGLLVNEIITEENFRKKKIEGTLNTIDEYENIIGKPDTSVEAYEFMKGGKIKKYYYCWIPSMIQNCTGYQITVKDNLVTSTHPYWGTHEFNFIKPFLFENWMWNRFFGLLPFKDFS